MLCPLAQQAMYFQKNCWDLGQDFSALDIYVIALKLASWYRGLHMGLELR